MIYNWISSHYIYSPRSTRATRLLVLVFGASDENLAKWHFRFSDINLPCTERWNAWWCISFRWVYDIRLLEWCYFSPRAHANQGWKCVYKLETYKLLSNEIFDQLKHSSHKILFYISWYETQECRNIYFCPKHQNSWLVNNIRWRLFCNFRIQIYTQ